ncbi:zinc-dependent alcohol dehydrogenase family protein [Acinetobacter sp. ANC 4648]|uniref:zinc-dependent alcohol dehydrogenase family protein n=1 Tax=Acinetobacter sp. ANC 4648 TaxID=1977875 RepID=UPI000A33D2FC|nr:zinc-dependent alcohol dehydrogenase family protein [Acinetobacter sp. ANC 4648]OTG81724.1 quinone oxidoreductase [Acinetobacter sp. ANC 4648]
MNTGKMKALILKSYETGTLHLENINIPKLVNGHVLVKIAVSGTNPIDNKIRTGQAPYAMPELPAIIGTDMAGTIIAVADDVDHFAVGNEVYGLVGGVRGLPGTLAEYVLADVRLIALKPKNLTMREAAAIPLTFLTAWEGLIDKANIQPEQTVLVQGGAGGVGHMAVQIAVAHGAKVYAIASQAKKEIIESYGAIFSDYNQQTIHECVTEFTAGKGFDVIYNTNGGKQLEQVLEATVPYGHIISSNAFSEINLAPSSLRNVTISGVFILWPMLENNRRQHHGDILKIATQLAEENKLKPLVDPREFDITQTVEAHHYLAEGKALGKIVINIPHDANVK